MRASRTAAAAGGCMLVRTDALRRDRRVRGDSRRVDRRLHDGGRAEAPSAADLARHEPLGAQPARVRRARRFLEHGEPQRVHAAPLLDRAGCCSRPCSWRSTLLAPVAGLALGAGGGRAAAWRWRRRRLARDRGAAYWPVVALLSLAGRVGAHVAASRRALFLAMTWSSALSYWRGTRASWKARDYGRSEGPRPARPLSPLVPECHRRVTALRPLS